MGSCAAPSAKGDDKFITTDYLQQCPLFNGGIPGLLEKSHQDMAWRDLVDYSITAVPIITSGRTSRKLQRSEYESIAKKLKSLRI
ncbi:TPA: hypothetical protein ACN7YL_004774, partial [Klebsiella pneumoniae]